MLTHLFALLPTLLTPGSLMPVFLQIDDVEVGAEAEVGAGGEAEAEAEVSAPSPEDAAQAAEPDPTPAPRQPNAMAAQLAQRAQIRDVHRAFGIATWISLAGTLVLGGIQLHDDYGPFADSAVNTPCTAGGAVFTDYCFDAVPVPHLVSAAVSSALYYTTFTLSFFMPDPLGIADSPGWAGDRLRIHKTLRWLHFAGMVITSIFGAVTANLSPTDADFGTRQALAITHFALGTTTFALLSAAAIVILI